MILRLEAQRACLNWARTAVADLPGPIVELGLGNGRTYDHLRSLFPDRHIFVLERQPAPHPACMPDAQHLIVGDLRDTLPGLLAMIGSPAAFVHSDIGTADAARNARIAAWLAEALPPLVAPGGLVASDQKLDSDALERLPLPGGLPVDRYFLYRRRANRAGA